MLLHVDEIIAGVLVFRQMISSDDQTRNHFLMILCTGLQLHMLTKSRLLCSVYLTKRPDCCIEVCSRPI